MGRGRKGGLETEHKNVAVTVIYTINIDLCVYVCVLSTCDLTS